MFGHQLRYNKLYHICVERGICLSIAYQVVGSPCQRLKHASGSKARVAVNNEASEGREAQDAH